MSGMTILFFYKKESPQNSFRVKSYSNFKYVVFLSFFRPDFPPKSAYFRTLTLSESRGEFIFYTEKLCTSAPRDAERVKGQTNIPFCIEFHALSNGHVRFIVATNPNFNMTPQNFAENLKFSKKILMLILTN